MSTFEHKSLVTLSDTDAAGVVYFARFFDIAHRAMETYFAEQSLSLGKILREKEYMTPVTSSSAEYKRPLRLSDEITLKGTFLLDSETSYQTEIDIFLPSGELAAKVRFTHTCIDKATWKRRSMPEEMRKLLGA